MKKYELMVMDWVYSPTPTIPKAIQIMYGWQIEECETQGFLPIPLTPEILEKNEFERVLDEDGTECYRYYNREADGYIKISLYHGGDGDWSIEIVNYEKFNDNEIVYNNNFIFLKVHQLQHALRLCKIKKEIIL